MANSPQAKKRAHQAESHRQLNAGQRAAMRTALKKAIKALDAGDKTSAKTATVEASRLVDKNAGKGLIHKNKAAHYKRRLNQRLRALS